MWFWGTLLVTLAADGGSKAWVRKKLALEEKREVIPELLYLYHRKNKGFAYNRLEKHPAWVVRISGGVLALLAALLFTSSQKGKAISIASGLLLGGGSANLWERVQRKSVTDFLYLRGRGLPIFNIADVCILLGGVLWCIITLFGKQN